MLYIRRALPLHRIYRMYDEKNSVHVIYFDKINTYLKKLGHEPITGENESNLIVAMLDLHAPVKECVSSLVELRNNLSKY